MNWCEKHDHFKRTCPWCEIEILQERLGDIDTPAEKLQRMEDEISALKDKLSGLKKEKYQLVMQVVERNAEIAELKEENERFEEEYERLRKENAELFHFKQTAEFVLNEETLKIIESEMTRTEDV